MKIIQISKTPESDILRQLYKINQQHAHYLTDLSSDVELSKLINLSDVCMYGLNNGSVVGFMICFREKSEHRSLNYKYFNERETRFIYVDRIAINNDYLGLGHGSQLYKELYKYAAPKNLPICCEVYTRPKNIVSLNFHYKNGFKPIDSYDFENYSVEYLKRTIL